MVFLPAKTRCSVKLGALGSGFRRFEHVFGMSEGVAVSHICCLFDTMQLMKYIINSYNNKKKKFSPIIDERVITELGALNSDFWFLKNGRTDILDSCCCCLMHRETQGTRAV